MRSHIVSALVAAAVLSLTDAQAASGAADCSEPDLKAMNQWFPHDQTRPPSSTLTSTTNCAFHIWSTQMFLWLTQNDPATGQPRVLSQYSLDELFAPLGTEAEARAKATAVLRLTPKTSKSDSPDLDEFQQAGSRGILVDQNHRAVYYSQLVNETFYTFVRNRFFDRVPGGTFDPALLAEATGQKDFFPSGALELKVSWKIVGEGEGGGWFTVPAEIHKLKEVDGKIVVDPDNPEPVVVAMVGMHVVGRVDDHPEMIWATFEHRDNAPDLPTGMAPDSSDPVSDRNWTFYAAGTAAKASNQNPRGNLQFDPASSQNLKPVVNVFRQFGMGTIDGGQGAPTNRANIEMINGFIEKNFQPAASVWRNYMEVGSIWMLPNTLQPGQFPITELRGSTMLSNATMETYTQSGAQCFSCHNTLPVRLPVGGREVTLPATNFNISHVMVGEYFRAMAAQQGSKVRALR